MVELINQATITGSAPTTTNETKEGVVDVDDSFVQGTPLSNEQMIMTELFGTSGTLKATFRLYHHDKDAGWVKGRLIDLTSIQTSAGAKAREFTLVKYIDKFTLIGIVVEEISGTGAKASAWSYASR